MNNGNGKMDKKFIVNGKDVIDFMLGDMGLGLSVDEIVATLEMKVDKKWINAHTIACCCGIS